MAKNLPVCVAHNGRIDDACPACWGGSANPNMPPMIFEWQLTVRVTGIACPNMLSISLIYERHTNYCSARDEVAMRINGQSP